jgi:hypothetical protein
MPFLPFFLVAPGVSWTYRNLWSAKTTWGGNDPPSAGDTVVITAGEHILLDVTPPPLVLVIVLGTLEFLDTADVGLNASYIVVNGGWLKVGTEDTPFMHKATLTLHGPRAMHEVPVYGAKCLGVRHGILDLHGRPKIKWTKLALTAQPGSNWIELQESVDWTRGDLIVVSSTSYNQEEAETMRVARVHPNRTRVSLQSNLVYRHEGEGWLDPAEPEASAYINGYRASVGLLTSNVVVEGDHYHSKREQFGGQITLHSRGDNSLKARMSHIELRNMGQGLKLGKYPIHFHLIGSVTESFVKGVSIRNSFNRAVAIHGVNHLRVQNCVVFDTRGHAIFLEDGTEMHNIIENNLVAVVRPVWSLLTVDQSPAAFWIVNPNNIVRGNVAAGTSHYGFWYRSLEHPDGVSGAEAVQECGTPGCETKCPMWTPLGVFEDNVAHSTGKFGLKITQYFPAENGFDCQTPTFSVPAHFRRFTAFFNNFFGIWGENMVDVHFDQLAIVEHGIAAMEFIYMNGRHSQFATSNITNSLFAGSLTAISKRAHRGAGTAEASKFIRFEDAKEAFFGLENSDMLRNT